MKETFYIISAVLIVVISSLLTGYGVGLDKAQRDAVKLGVAHYESNEAGYPVFKYKRFYFNN